MKTTIINVVIAIVTIKNGRLHILLALNKITTKGVSKMIMILHTIAFLSLALLFHKKSWGFLFVR